MFVHAIDAVRQGCKRTVFRKVDTDVLVLRIAMVIQLKQVDPGIELWIGFSSGSHLRYFEKHTIAEKLGLEVSKALSFFHALTGCDTVSSFAGKRKDSLGSMDGLSREYTVTALVPSTNLLSSQQVDQ